MQFLILSPAFSLSIVGTRLAKKWTIWLMIGSIKFELQKYLEVQVSVVTQIKKLVVKSRLQP